MEAKKVFFDPRLQIDDLAMPLVEGRGDSIASSWWTAGRGMKHVPAILTYFKNQGVMSLLVVTLIPDNILSLALGYMIISYATGLGWPLEFPWGKGTNVTPYWDLAAVMISLEPAPEPVKNWAGQSSAPQLGREQNSPNLCVSQPNPSSGPPSFLPVSICRVWPHRRTHTQSPDCAMVERGQGGSLQLLAFNNLLSSNL